jgi:hypothetical protein
MEAGQIEFAAEMFHQILFDEYQIAFGLPREQDGLPREQDIKVQKQHVTRKGDKIGDLITQVCVTQTIKSRDKVDAEVNKLTTMDSYRHSLYAINSSRDQLFNCGIERTDLEFSTDLELGMHESYSSYILRNKSVSVSEDDIKKNYIKNVLFKAFYNYCIREIPDVNISDIYRFFIRMLCLFSGFVIPTLITGLQMDVILTPVTPQSSPESSPPQPQQAQPERVSRVLHRKNVIYLTPSRELSFETLLIYEITDTQGNTSGIFEIPIGYSLQGMSNRPLYMSLSTLFDMINEFRQNKHKFRSDIFIKLRDENIKKLHSKESTFTTIFKGFQYIGGRTKKTSKKCIESQKVKVKKSKSKSQSQKVKVKKSKSKSQSQKVKVKVKK